jgi:hypothetical protein
MLLDRNSPSQYRSDSAVLWGTGNKVGGAARNTCAA